MYYLKVWTVQKDHEIGEYYYGKESGPFSERPMVELAAANALGQQGIIRVAISERDSSGEED